MKNGQKAASENFSSCDALTDQNAKSESGMIKKNRSVNFADFWFSTERPMLAPKYPTTWTAKDEAKNSIFIWQFRMKHTI